MKSVYFVNSPYHVLTALVNIFENPETSATIVVAYENKLTLDAMRPLLDNIISLGIDVVEFKPNWKDSVQQVFRMNSSRLKKIIGDDSTLYVNTWLLDYMQRNSQLLTANSSLYKRIVLVEDGSLVYLRGLRKMTLKQIVRYALFNIKKPELVIHHVRATQVTFPNRYPDEVRELLTDLDLEKRIHDLSSDIKETLLKLFSVPETLMGLISSNEKNPNKIIFTQDLARHGLVDSLDNQKMIFDTLINRYVTNNDFAIVKKHPFDVADYDFSDNVLVVSDPFPAELFYVLGIHFDQSIGVFSSAVEGVQADEYVYDTTEYKELREKK